MGTLIDELLQFSRLGHSDIRKIPINVNELVEEVKRELEPGIRNRTIHWHVEQLPVVIADQGMLRQVIENLLGNSLKFTRQRDEAEIVIGSTFGANGELVIFIRDNGAGFDMQYYNKLFQVFQRLHSEDEFEGTGIGLANVRRMVERQGGRVWAEGAVGTGATFYFTLPSGGNVTGEQNEYIEAHLTN
jgi:light-regulated signal transduction histidine kinase (bacteriophytochrome)